MKEKKHLEIVDYREHILVKLKYKSRGKVSTWLDYIASLNVCAMYAIAHSWKTSVKYL